MKKMALFLGLLGALTPLLTFAQADAGSLLSGTLSARGELCSQGICLPTEETPLIVWVITTVFSILGILFLGLMLYAGFLWMTAGGNTEQVVKAKRILVQATVGLIITLSSFAIANTVLSRIQSLQSTQGQPYIAP